MTAPPRSSLRHRVHRQRAVRDPAAVRLTLLGGFELLCGQRVAPVPPRIVSGRLWIDVSQEQAFGALRTTLWRVHRVRAPVIEATSTQLALAPSVVVDVRELEASAQRALHRRAPLGPVDFDQLTEARELLPDWYDEWVVQEREQLAQLRLHALEAACEELVATGRFRDATRAALAAVTADPLRESARSLLITAYLGSGAHVEAARQFVDFRQRLKSELGLEPSLRMLELVHAVDSPDGPLSRVSVTNQ